MLFTQNAGLVDVKRYLNKKGLLCAKSKIYASLLKCNWSEDTLMCKAERPSNFFPKLSHKIRLSR